MDDNTKLEIAIEVMGSKIASALREGYTVEDLYFQNLLYEKNEMYKCNMQIIDKIILVYGGELKYGRKNTRRS